jgi:ABC-2 type transport system permease protein
MMSELLLPAWTLLVRELTHFVRQRHRILGTIGTPLVFWVLIGSGLSGSFRPGTAGSSDAVHGMTYLQYFFPGTLVLILLFTAVFSTISIIEDRRAGFLQGVLVAPVPRSAVVLGKVLGGTAVAVLQGILVLALAPFVGIHLTVGGAALALLVVLITSFQLTSLGFLIAWRMETTTGFHAIMNLFLIPLWLLSGALFPASGAAPWLKTVMAVNPLAYAMSALRAALYPAGSLTSLGVAPFALSITVTLIATAVLFSGGVVMARRGSWAHG